MSCVKVRLCFDRLSTSLEPSILLLLRLPSDSCHPTVKRSLVKDGNVNDYLFDNKTESIISLVLLEHGSLLISSSHEIICLVDE